MVARILAVVIALSVALSPIAATALPAPIPAQTSMSHDGHSCYPHAMQACDTSNDGCISMTACAAPAVLATPSAQVFVFLPATDKGHALRFNPIVPSPTNGPPPRPPQA